LKLTPPFPSAGIESIFVRDTTIEITYVGLGGGGVGATICRALAEDVLEYDVTDAGGSKMSRGTITLPKRKRVIIGVDDTDTTEEGATWSLAHNICRRVDDKDARYVSHSIVQLYPVEAKTQNCVATVVEFACTDDPSGSFRRLLQRYTLSDETGMAVLSKFDAKKMEEFGKRCKKMEVRKEEAIKVAEENGVILEMDKRGIIGAVAAIPYFARPEASIVL
jgi:methanogenesis imperfect marker protein 11